EEVWRHRSQFLWVASCFKQLTMFNEAVDSLFDVLPERTKAVVLRVVLDVAPDVGALVERYVVAHCPLKDSLERLSLGFHRRDPSEDDATRRRTRSPHT